MRALLLLLLPSCLYVETTGDPSSRNSVGAFFECEVIFYCTDNNQRVHEQTWSALHCDERQYETSTLHEECMIYGEALCGYSAEGHRKWHCETTCEPSTFHTPCLIPEEVPFPPKERD